ncbi:hypothetical protein V2A60_003226 [Cordyceps javanica]
MCDWDPYFSDLRPAVLKNTKSHQVSKVYKHLQLWGTRQPEPEPEPESEACFQLTRKYVNVDVYGWDNSEGTTEDPAWKLHNLRRDDGLKHGGLVF